MNQSRKNKVAWRHTMEETSREFETRRIESIKKIEGIAQSVDATQLFMAVATIMSFGPAEAMTESNFGSVPVKLELLAYYIYPFFGKCDKKITPYHTNECLLALDTLLSSYTFEGFHIGSQEDPIARVVNDVHARARIVRGSAYPEQTSREIEEVQGRFESWFSKKLQVGPMRAVRILKTIRQCMENRFNEHLPEIRKHTCEYGSEWEKANKKQGEKTKDEQLMLRTFESKNSAQWYGYIEGLNEVAFETATVSLSDITDIEPGVTWLEWEGLISLIGLTIEDRQGMADPIEVSKRPFFVLPNNRVFFVDGSHILDLLWMRYDNAAKTYQKYQKHKSKWLEDKITEYLSKIFPLKNICKNLTYPNPDKSDGSIAEIDFVIEWGPFLVLIEAKAKQFRIESQLGDAGRLRTDIKANVEDAFEQVRRAARYIEKSAKPKFIKRKSNQELVINKNNIQRTYLLTVSQHYMAGLATDLAALKSLELFKDDEYPVSLCLADLEIISEFCDGSDVFLHYIERRLATQKEKVFVCTDEIDFFGAYLDTRLRIEDRFLKKGERKPNWINLGPWSNEFDDWMKYKRGNISEPPSIRLKVPDEIQEILEELRKNDSDDAAKWIAFALLDMSDKCLAMISKAVKDLRKAELTSGKFRRLVVQDQDTVISFTASLDLPKPLLHKRTAERAIIEKYRRKALKSISFGIMVLDSKLIECASWLEGPWEPDEKMERLIEAEPPFMPALGQKLPGRNEPCLCGSGKKFKKCCLLRFKTEGKINQDNL
jgi:hypothetical protein